mmetsp:Transcript_96893/g.271209  ORF Transcript_96893/g.271209 Transcript_96893/m.271209 type:complete len:195 (+) Transcript_96893:99-683(+)
MRPATPPPIGRVALWLLPVLCDAARKQTAGIAPGIPPLATGQVNVPNWMSAGAMSEHVRPSRLSEGAAAYASAVARECGDCAPGEPRHVSGPVLMDPVPIFDDYLGYWPIPNYFFDYPGGLHPQAGTAPWGCSGAADGAHMPGGAAPPTSQDAPAMGTAPLLAEPRGAGGGDGLAVPPPLAARRYDGGGGAGVA